MNTDTLLEHLDAAQVSLRQGDLERALALVLDVYEARHFTDELGVALRRVESGEPSASSELLSLLETLHARTAPDLEQEGELGMSLSDFFADVPGSSPENSTATPPEEANVEDELADFDMVEISSAPELDDHFSFADLGGELSFENLDLAFSSDGDGGESDSLLDDIWPEDSIVIDEGEELPLLDEISSDEAISPLDDDESSVSQPQATSEPSNSESVSPPEPKQSAPTEDARLTGAPVELSDPLVDDSPAFEASDAQSFDGFFDELDEQAQWFSADQSSEEEEVVSQPPAHAEARFEEDEHVLVEVEAEDIAISLESPGISGVSETQDGLDVFDIFNQAAQKTNDSVQVSPQEEQPAEDAKPSESEPEASSSLPLPPALAQPEQLTQQQAVVPPATHEPEASPELDFDLDFDLDEIVPEASEATSAPEPVSEAPSPHVTPTIPQDEIELFDDLFDFDSPLEPEAVAAPHSPPATHKPEASPSLDFDFGLEDISADSAPSSPAPQSSLPLPGSLSSPQKLDEPPTRQVNLDELAAQPLEGIASANNNTQGGLPGQNEAASRETRSMPVVDRELVNPFERDDDNYFGDDADDWNFGDEEAKMPGLDDDWLDAPEPQDAAPKLDARDVHNDATAIPGLNASNSGLPFNPYNEGGVSRTPSNPPESFQEGRSASTSSSLKRTQEGDAIPIRAVRETLENKELVEPASSPPPTNPSTLEHDYRDAAPLGGGEDESDPFDFDLGLNAPKLRDMSRSNPPPGAGEDISNTQKSVSSTMFGIPFAASPEPTPSSRQHSMPTPVPATPAARPSHKDISEDEFFALAESIAAEQSVAIADDSSGVPKLKPYRGEPMMRGEPSRGRLSTLPVPPVQTIEPPQNPFQQQTPTGVKHALVEESSQVSFALEEVEDDELDVGFVPAHLEEDQEKLQLERAREAYENGHFEDALDMVSPLRQSVYKTEADTLYRAIERELERLQLERLGSLERTPVIDVPLDQLATFNIDHRAGFLLSQIDGFLTFEDILDLSAMSRLETILVLADLLDQQVIKTV